MTWGPQLDFLKGLKADGREVPALDNQPALDARLVYFQRAFIQISPSRRKTESGFPLYLTLRDYLDYFEMFYVHSVTEREYHISMFQALDEVYVRVMQEKVKSEIEAENKRRGVT